MVDSQSTQSTEVEELEKQLYATQEILAFVLLSVGKDVVITKESMTRENIGDRLIFVNDDVQRDAFIVGLRSADVLDEG